MKAVFTEGDGVSGLGFMAIAGCILAYLAKDGGGLFRVEPTLACAAIEVEARRLDDCCMGVLVAPMAGGVEFDYVCWRLAG